MKQSECEKRFVNATGEIMSHQYLPASPTANRHGSENRLVECTKQFGSLIFPQLVLSV